MPKTDPEKYIPPNKVIGDFIRKRRTAKGLTLRELAPYTTIGYSMLSKVETGKAGILEVDLRSLAWYLGGDLRELEQELGFVPGALGKEEPLTPKGYLEQAIMDDICAKCVNLDFREVAKLTKEVLEFIDFKIYRETTKGRTL